jgi:hypothetical protein
MKYRGVLLPRRSSIEPPFRSFGAGEGARGCAETGGGLDKAATYGLARLQLGSPERSLVWPCPRETQLMKCEDAENATRMMEQFRSGEAMV